MSYVQIVESWAKGTPRGSAYVGLAAFIFDSFEQAQAHVPPVTQNDHYDSEVKVIQATIPAPPAPVPAADSPEGRAMIEGALTKAQEWEGK